MKARCELLAPLPNFKISEQILLSRAGGKEEERGAVLELKKSVANLEQTKDSVFTIY